MPSAVSFLGMMIGQQAGFQVLKRTREPSELTDADDNVIQYDRVMSTKLTMAYAAGLEAIHRARLTSTSGISIDLASGPGHYTLCLARYLGYARVTGIDLSPGMVEVANQNAVERKLQGQVQFRQGDITQLDDVPDGELDLASFTDAAHHMPDLATVGSVLREMDRITKPDGLVMVMDLVRLRTAKLTERYVNTLGHDYVERGLPAFLEDFRNSQYAAWTAKELHEAIPRDSNRYWCHIVPRGLPTIQVILGLPVGRKRPFVRSGFPWSPEDNPVPPEMRTEWRLLRTTLRFASKRFVPPGNAPS